MSAASENLLEPDDAKLVARRDERRAAAVACGAHALHDGYTDLIYVMLPVWQAGIRARLRGARAVARPVRRHHGELPDSGRPGRRTAGRRGGARARHRARRPRLLPGRRQHRLRHADGRAFRRRARRQHPASARLQLDGAGIRRAALDEGARHLQFRRRHRQDDPAGGRLAAAGGDGVAAGAGAARRARPCRRGRDLPGDAALWAGAGCGAGRGRRPPRAPAARAIASPFRCCCRSACSTARPAWASCCSCRSCSPPRAPACRPSGLR